MNQQPGFLEDAADHPAISMATATTEAQVSASVEPRLLEADATQAGRVEPDWEPETLGPSQSGIRSLSFLSWGLALLAMGWLGLSVIGFIVDQFGRSTGLGTLTLIVVGPALALVGYGIRLEASAYRSLRNVDALRAQLARADFDPAEAKKSSQNWLRSIASQFPDAAAAEAAITRATTAGEVKAILRTRVLDPLRQQASQIGRRAAIQGGAVVAVTPSPALDGVLAGVLGIAVIRQVAQVYSLRPGLAVTIALLRRVAGTIAAVSGAELLSRSLADHMLEKLPFVRHLAGAIPGTSVAAIRLYRLACVTAEACSPLSD
jgi:putative membrane protein